MLPRSEQRNVRRVLVATKYRFLGDTLLVIPLLRRIAELWPEAEVTLLTGPAAQELLENCPYFQHTISFDPYRRSDEGFLRFGQVVGQVRRGNFDAAFVCNRSFHSALIARLGGAPVRIGWAGFQGRDFLLTRTVPYDKHAPEICSYLDLLTPYGIADTADTSACKTQLWLSNAERIASARIVPFTPPAKIIGIQPGATHSEKRWGTAKYAALLDRLRATDPLCGFVLIGGPDEIADASALMEMCGPAVRETTVNLVGKLKLRQTLAALSRLSVFLAGDTAIRHAAMALDVPTVALFGPTSVRKWGNASPPRHTVLQAAGKRVDDITVEDVYQSLAHATLPTPRLEPSSPASRSEAIAGAGPSNARDAQV